MNLQNSVIKKYTVSANLVSPEIYGLNQEKGKA